jgi:hypothetical protein
MESTEDEDDMRVVVDGLVVTRGEKSRKERRRLLYRRREEEGWGPGTRQREMVGGLAARGSTQGWID